MSMHLRGSRDMMGHQEEEGWWKSRTGLEQKLLILSTLLFILSFGLTISVIVLKNKTCPGCPEISTTTEPSTGSTETSIATSPDEPITGDTATVTESVPPSVTESVPPSVTESVPPSVTETVPPSVTETVPTTAPEPSVPSKDSVAE